METAPLLIALGALFLAGLAADAIGQRTRLPRVTLLLACGIVAGGSGLDLLPREIQALYDVSSTVALTMVAFLLGNSLTLGTLRKHGRAILSVSILIVLATVALVATGLWLAGLPAPVAILLGAIATATDPAATQDALRQSGARGPFAERLRGIVAIDDAWGLLTFSLAVVVAGGLTGGMECRASAMRCGKSAGRWARPADRAARGVSHRPPRPGRAAADRGAGRGLSHRGSRDDGGGVVPAGGDDGGDVVANRAHHHARAFHEIEHIQWPFMILFFVLAGATLDLARVGALGGVVAACAGLRILGRLAGGWIGGTLAGAPRAHRAWYGVGAAAAGGGGRGHGAHRRAGVSRPCRSAFRDDRRDHGDLRGDRPVGDGARRAARRRGQRLRALRPPAPSTPA